MLGKGTFFFTLMGMERFPPAMRSVTKKGGDSSSPVDARGEPVNDFGLWEWAQILYNPDVEGESSPPMTAGERTTGIPSPSYSLLPATSEKGGVHSPIRLSLGGGKGRT